MRLRLVWAMAARLPTSKEPMANSDNMQYALIGFTVQDASGQTIYSNMGNTGLAPASCQKIVTAAAAFDQLGSNFRYSTNVSLSGTANGKSYSLTVLLLKNDGNVRILTEVNGEKAMFVTPLSQVTPVNPALGSAIVTAGEGSTTIAGQSCKKYSIESAQGSSTIFVTNQVKIGLDDLPQMLKSNGIFATLAANGITGLPLSIISRGEDGKVTFSQTVTAIIPGSVADSEFSFEGYSDGGAALQNSMKQN